MKLLYFSWIKDYIGKSEEEINIDEQVKTISDLIDLLISTNEDYKKVFSDLSSVKVSKNMNLVGFDENVNNNDEVAFFPPMTGG